MESIRIKGMKVLLFIATIAITLSYTSSVFATSLGSVQNSVNEVGQLSNQGDVKLTKTVSATEEEGVYEITLTAEGVNKQVTNVTNEEVPLYVVVVLDESGSMSYYGRWTNAVKGAQSFATNLLAKYPTAQIALVTFSTNASVIRNFASEEFASDIFSNSPYGMTNLAEAIKTGSDLLSGKEDNAKLYMVILSDGYPEYTSAQESAGLNNHDEEAQIAKNEGIEIFTIGYETNDVKEATLKSVATDENHFVKADTTNIVESFNNIVSTGINVEIPAGRNAVITDTIGEGFTIVDDSLSTDGKSVSFDIGDITEEGKTISFKIKMNDDLKAGTYSTNEGASVTYTNVDGEEQTLTIDSSSTITVYDDDVIVEVEEEIEAPKTGVNDTNNSYVTYLLVISSISALVVTIKIING